MKTGQFNFDFLFKKCCKNTSTERCPQGNACFVRQACLPQLIPQRLIRVLSGIFLLDLWRKTLFLLELPNL